MPISQYPWNLIVPLFWISYVLPRGNKINAPLIIHFNINVLIYYTKHWKYKTKIQSICSQY